MPRHLAFLKGGVGHQPLTADESELHRRVELHVGVEGGEPEHSVRLPGVLGVGFEMGGQAVRTGDIVIVEEQCHVPGRHLYATAARFAQALVRRLADQPGAQDP